MNGDGILISEAALERLGLSGASRVNLWWDAERCMVGVSAASEEDAGAFKLSRRGRSTRMRFVAAAKFYERFGFTMEGKTQVAILRELDGIPAFKIDSALIAPTGRRRSANRAPSV